jgi:hypothetical protein
MLRVVWHGASPLFQLGFSLKDIRTTMIYLHVMEGGTTDVRSPLDLLED